MQVEKIEKDVLMLCIQRLLLLLLLLVSTLSPVGRHLEGQGYA